MHESIVNVLDNNEDDCYMLYSHKIGMFDSRSPYRVVLSATLVENLMERIQTYINMDTYW